MQKGITIALLLFCFLGASLQAQTFSPIHPGSLHVDEFSTLDNDRVNVPSFTVGNFGAAVLDFQSLTSATPVNIDIAGGVNFQGNLLQFISAGDVGVNSEVNDLSVNAIQGQVLFQTTSGGITTTSMYGDLALDSGNKNINLQAPTGSISFDSSTFLLNGREDSQGVQLTTENNGDVVIEAGQTNNVITSQVNVAGYDVALELQSSTDFSTSLGDIYLLAGSGIDVSASSVSFTSSNGVSVTSDISNILIEADGEFGISSNNLQILSSNGQSYASVTGNIGISSITTSDYQSLDSIQLTGVNNGVYVNAAENITADASNNFFLNSDGPLAISSTDFAITSVNDKFIFDTNGDIGITTSTRADFITVGDMNADAQDTFNIGGRGVSFTTQVDAKLNSGNSFQVSTNADAIFNSNNLYVDGLENFNFYGNSLSIVANDFTARSGLDVGLLSSDVAKFSYGNDGYISGYSVVYFDTQGTSSISANNIAITAGGDISTEADSISYTLNGKLSIYGTNIAAEGGFLTLESFSLDLTGRKISAFAESAITFYADASVELKAENNFNLKSNSYISKSSEYQLLAVNDLYTTTDDKVIFSAEFASILLQAGLDITFSAGYGYLSGGSLSITSSEDAHLFARNTFSLSSNEINFKLQENFSLKSDGQFDFYTGNLTLTSTNAYFTATDGLGGAITFSSEGPVSITAVKNYISGTANEVIFQASKAINFDTSDEFNLNSDAGDVLFNSGSTFTHTTARGDSTFNSNSYSVNGDQSISLSTDFLGGGISISSSLKQDVSFNSGGDLTLSNIGNGNMLFSSLFVSFDAVESGSISSANFSIDASSNIAFQSNDYINFNSTNTIDSVINGPASFTGAESITETGASLTYNLNSAIINANGGGARFYSTNDTVITTSTSDNALFIKAYNLNSYTAKNGSVSMTSNDVFTIEGGESSYYSGVNNTILISAIDSISMSTSNMGNFTVFSDFDFLENAFDAININGLPGKDSYISSTYNDSDICINSFLPGATTFQAGKSMEVQAYGEKGFLQAFADNSISITSDEYSIGILSEGSQTDPQNLLKDTFGILFRTTHEKDDKSQIDIISDTGSINMFARNNINVISKAGKISTTASGKTDIRSVFYGANILIQATDGDIAQEISNGYYISGTPSIQADTLVNATGTSTWTATTGTVEIVQQSTIQDPSDAGIIFEAYHGALDISATADCQMFAVDGGKIFFETRNGNMNFDSNTLSVNANTGAIALEGRTSAQFTANEYISFTAAGTGGTILIATPGGNDVSFNSIDEYTEFSSTIGEIDFDATTGINFASGKVTTLSGACNHLYGGGSLNLEGQTAISLTSTDNSIGIAAQNEFTVDATNKFYVGNEDPLPLVRINAGGDSITDGFSLTSNGDVLFTTQNNLYLYSVFSSFLSDSNIDLIITNSLNFTTFGDSTTQTNIILEAQSGDIDITSPDYSTQSLTQTTITSQGPITFNSGTGSIDVTAEREIRYRSKTMVITADDYLVSAANQRYISNIGDITFNSGTTYTALSDSEFYVTSGDTLNFQATSGTLNIKNNNGAIDNQATNDISITGFNAFTANSQGGTEIDSNAGIDVTGTESTTISGATGVIFTAKSDISYLNIKDYTEIANDHEVNAKDISITTQTATFDTYHFNIDAGTDFSLSAKDITIAGPIQTINYIAQNELDITSNMQSYTANDNLYITSTANVDNYFKNGINMNVNSVSVTTPTTSGIFSIQSRGNTVLQNAARGGIIRFDGDENSHISFISSGQSGIVVTSDTYLHSTKNEMSINAEEGDIIFDTASFKLTSSDSISFAAHNEGSIRLTGQGNAQFNAPTFIIQPLEDPGRQKGNGNISFVGESITVNSDSLDFDSNANLFHTAMKDITLTANNGPITLSVNRRLDLTSQSVTLTSQTDIEINAQGSFADLLVKTTIFYGSYDNGITDVTKGEMIFESGNNIYVYSSGSITLTSKDNLKVLADSSWIDLEANNINVDSTGSFTVNAETYSITQTYPTYTLTTEDLIAHADGEIYISDLAEIRSTTTDDPLTFDSARDLVVSTQTITSSADGTSTTATAGQGDILVKSGSSISVSAGAALSITAHGNLGALGGAYVLWDQYGDGRDGNTDPRHMQHLININTDAIEFVAVEGEVLVRAHDDILLKSGKGNLDFRAIRNILYKVTYFAPDNFNQGGRVTFFNVLTHSPQYPGTGMLRNVPFAYSDDYCFGGAVECVQLSSMLNKIVQTMVNYGLLYPSPVKGFPFTP